MERSSGLSLCPRDAFVFSPGRLSLSSHAFPGARCFVALVSEELHLVSVVPVNAPSTDFFVFDLNFSAQN